MAQLSQSFSIWDCLHRAYTRPDLSLVSHRIGAYPSLPNYRLLTDSRGKVTIVFSYVPTGEPSERFQTHAQMALFILRGALCQTKTMSVRPGLTGKMEG